MSNRNVIVIKTDGSTEIFRNAYLQADDPAILIRQAFSDNPGAYTTTAVFSPGTYREARYTVTDSEVSK